MFVASKVFWTVASPDNLIVLLLAGALLIPGRPNGASAWRGRRVAFAVAVALVALAVLPVGPWLLGPLEDRFPLVEPPAHVDGIIVVGGSVDPLISKERHQPALTDAAARLTEFVRLARRYPEARLVFAGGSGSVVHPDLTEAPVVRAVLDGLGLPADRVLFEERSRNTYENAVFSKALAHPAPGETWLLVTSAFHMPRSVGIFRAAGWPVLPYPTDYRTTPEDQWRLRFDLLVGLRDAAIASHEWIGLVVYRLLGRTTALFPGPL